MSVFFNVKLTYFKRSGKRYSDGWYTSSCEHMFQVYQEVAQLRATGRLPGLIERSSHEDFVVLVEVPGHIYNVPQLIGADDANDILQAIVNLGPRPDRHYCEPTDDDQQRWDRWDEQYNAQIKAAKKLGVIE